MFNLTFLGFEWITLENPVVRFLVSMIWGLGIAALIKPSIDRCQVFRAPDLEKTNDKVWQFDDKCYQFSPSPSHC